jgi:hypothetical protein
LAKNRSLEAENRRLQQKILSLNERSGGGYLSSSVSKSKALVPFKNEPLIKLRIQSLLRNNNSPSYKLAELVSGGVMRNINSLLKVNLEEVIFDSILKTKQVTLEMTDDEKDRRYLEDVTETDLKLDQSVKEYLNYLDIKNLSDLFKPPLLKAVRSANEFVNQMTINGRPNQIKLQDLLVDKLIVSFAGFCALLIIQDEETAKTVSSTQNDKYALQKRILEANVQLRLSLISAGYKVFRTPVEEANFLR